LGGERTEEFGQQRIEGGGLLDTTLDTVMPLPWLSQADLDEYVAAFRASGFRGGFNWYRNIHRSWELLAPFAAARIPQPSLFIAGSRDGTIRLPALRSAVDSLAKVLPGLRKTALVEGVVDVHYNIGEGRSEIVTEPTGLAAAREELARRGIRVTATTLGFDPKQTVSPSGEQLREVVSFLDALEELEAIRAYDTAKASGDEAIPFEQAIRELEGTTRKASRTR